jgi:DNA-binding SARP family transcriptional activator
LQIRRSQILARVALTEARLISIVAPAGFGKTTVAGMIADERGAAIICDAAGVTDLRGFARCVVSAIQPLSRDAGDLIANDLFANLQSEVSGAQLAGFVLDVWANIEGDAVCIFDNLEAIAECGDAMDLLVRLIRSSGVRTTILCARPPFALVNSRLIPPNEHLQIHIDDLAFTDDEIRSLFADTVDEFQVSRVVAITEGWPVAVLLLHQMSRLGQLDRTISGVAGAALDELRDYLLKEVLATIEGRLYDALVAVVATCPGGHDATFRATGGAVTPGTVIQLAQRLPLLSFARDGKCCVHPLIADLVENTAMCEVTQFRLAAARSYRDDNMPFEAARFYLGGGDCHTAAACLEGAVGSYLDSNTSATLDEIVERLPPQMLSQYPKLWAILSWIRSGVVAPEALLAEGNSLLDTLRDDGDSLEARQIGAVVVSLATQIGRHDVAERVLAGYELDENDDRAGNVVLLIADTFRRMLRGRTVGAMERYRRIVPQIRNDMLRAYLTLRVELVIATMSGQFDDAMLAEMRSIQYSKSGGHAGLIAEMPQHQVMAAWLAGDDAAADGFIRDISRMGAAAGFSGSAALVDAWETGRTEYLAEVLPRSRALTLLMLAGKVSDREARHKYLADARYAAEVADDHWSRLLINVACAMDDPLRRGEHLELAADLAREIGQEALTASVASLRNGGTGRPALAHLARRFEALPRESDSALLRVSVLSRAVYRGDGRLPLSNRVMSLITVLAVRERISKDDLRELLWGGESPEAEANALKMLVSRSRRQLGDSGAIVVSNGFYALRADVVVDYHQIRRFLGSLSLNGPLTDTQHTSLRAIYESFVPHWMSKQSVPQIDAAIASLRHQVVSRLAQDALDRGEIAFALTLADDLRREDQDDETAYELLIRAHLRVGKSADAIREYRQYSDHLMNDLGVEPTFSIADLLEGARA